MQVKCYQFDDICYYVTLMQDKVVQKFKGTKKEKLIKRTAYHSGKLGEPIPSPDGNGVLAMVLPEGVSMSDIAPQEEEAPVEEPSVENPSVEDPPENPGDNTPAEDPGESAELTV
jgi:hypothetical protein